MLDPERGVFAISVAAELSGTTIGNLRAYERSGLLRPGRTEGGSRRYSQNDVDRLVRIRGLLDAGLNAAGIEQVLALEAEIQRLEGQLAQYSAAQDSPQAPAQRRGRPSSTAR